MDYDAPDLVTWKSHQQRMSGKVELNTQTGSGVFVSRPSYFQAIAKTRKHTGRAKEVAPFCRSAPDIVPPSRSDDAMVAVGFQPTEVMRHAPCVA